MVFVSEKEPFTTSQNDRNVKAVPLQAVSLDLPDSRARGFTHHIVNARNKLKNVKKKFLLTMESSMSSCDIIPWY